MAKLGPKFRVTNLGARTKRCHICKEVKPFEEFPKSANSIGGVGSRCRPCESVYQSEWRRRNPELAFQTNSRAQLKDMCRRVGITVERYERELAAQGGVCKICHLPNRDARKRRLNIDHDHVTGEFRGLLCSTCNSALGHFGDNIALMEAAIAYLRASKPLFQVLDGIDG